MGAAVSWYVLGSSIVRVRWLFRWCLESCCFKVSCVRSFWCRSGSFKTGIFLFGVGVLGGGRGAVRGVVVVHGANLWVICVNGLGGGWFLWALKKLRNPVHHFGGSLLKGLPNLVKKVAVGVPTILTDKITLS